MDNFFEFFKIVLISIIIGVCFLLGIGFVAADAANEKHKSHILELNKKIQQQNDLFEELHEASESKINKLLIERNKAIKERNQYEKKVKKILSQRAIRSCDNVIPFSAEQSVPIVYECRPIN